LVSDLDGYGMAGIARSYDIVIAGGRVAGTAAAIGLAQQGYRVLLAERVAMPSDTLSTHFLWPDGVSALGRLGVLDEVLAEGTPEIHYFQSWDGKERLVADLVEIDGVDFGLCPRRTLLDGLLFERAAASRGVDAIDRARVVRLLHDGERVTGVELDYGGERREVAAGLVIGADGRNSLVAREVGAEKADVMPPGRYWYYAYFRSATPPEPTDSFIVSSAETDFIGSTLTNDGLQMVLYGAYDDDFESFRENHEANYLDRVKAHPAGARILAEAEPASTVYGIAGIEGYYRRAHGPGWALVGDAVHQKDPIAGRGISDALREAEWLAAALEDGISAAALDRYARMLREITWPKYQLAHIVARPDRYRTDEQGALLAERLVSDAALTEFMRLWYDDGARFDEYFASSL
jgi:2-polyprenyl-6-methoxyphenol hydroxylase-like FAD-dependent oxidoreductase